LPNPDSLSCQTLAASEDEANGLGAQNVLRTDFTNLLFGENADLLAARTVDIRRIAGFGAREEHPLLLRFGSRAIC
jgi:hypothetical protein